MRTKTLLIAAAALAAAVTSSQAQTVYSQNIVGYVNTTFPNAGAQYFVVTPLTNSTGMEADYLMASALQPGDTVEVWNKTAGNYAIYDYYGPNWDYPPYTNAWADSSGDPTNAPILSPGEGFYYITGSGSVETNTWTGTVDLSNSVALPTGGAQYAVGSSPPVAGLADDPSTINLPLQPGDTVEVWNQTAGNYAIYDYYGANWDFPPYTNAWADSSGDPTNAPYITVGQGFFYVTGSGSPETWNQNLIVQ